MEASVIERSLEREPTGERTRVAVCITTFRRREGLERALHSLEKLTFRSEPAPEVRVLVVDNDPESEIAADVLSSMPTHRFPLECLSESTRGISYARNTAVRAALTGGATWVAFLDDDETVRPTWLDELLSAARSFRADVVAGPVLPLFEEPVAGWVAKGRFFDRPRFVTGTELSDARTGNLLVASSALGSSALLFEESFALSGGEDTLLTRKLTSRGFRIIWADSAIVQELIPRNRTTLRWILKRAFAGGNSWTRIVHELNPGLRSRVVRFLRSAASVSAGLLLLIPSVLGGRHLFVRTATRIARGFGGLLGLLGWHVEAYGREL